ncbi:DUF1826 domain-containing protein [Ulvibacterium sp.]|uniref:DUF1826 domain-containing protein n=1 Tax=Ulvibacterium sp. TaxID=2665914 RepID=UPI003CC6D364
MILTNIPDDNAIIGDDIGILQDIHLKTKNIAIYQRGTESWMKGLNRAIKWPIQCRANGTVEEITFSLNYYFTNSPHLNESLLEDILSLLELFEQVTKSSFFRVLLATVNTNMCRRFHADNNELRMLCTYYGPGTLWLPDYAVDRKAYLARKSNQTILRNESLVQQVDTGDVVILKGALYPEAIPILHRSPSIEENSGERILLRIDTNESLKLLK